MADTLPPVPEGAHIELPLTRGDKFDLGWMGQTVTVVVDDVVLPLSLTARPVVTIQGHVMTEEERRVWDAQSARD